MSGLKWKDHKMTAKRFISFPLVEEFEFGSLPIDKEVPPAIEICTIELDCAKKTFRFGFTGQPESMTFSVAALYRLVSAMNKACWNYKMDREVWGSYTK